MLCPRNHHECSELAAWLEEATVYQKHTVVIWLSSKVGAQQNTYFHEALANNDIKTAQFGGTNLGHSALCFGKHMSQFYELTEPDSTCSTKERKEKLLSFKLSVNKN